VMVMLCFTVKKNKKVLGKLIAGCKAMVTNSGVHAH